LFLSVAALGTLAFRLAMPAESPAESTAQSAPSTKRPVVGYVIALALTAMALAAIPLLRAERARMRAEVEAARQSGLTVGATLDSLTAVAAMRSATLALETARAAARDVPKLHLVVAVDSGTVALMRDGVALRTMPAHFRGERPTRGTQTIRSIAEVVRVAVAPTVDSLGNTVATVAPEKTVERVVLTDGTVIEGGDAAAAFLGGVERSSGPRSIVVSRRDFAAIRPNLVRGMTAVLF
jgi:hypothetical protein